MNASVTSERVSIVEVGPRDGLQNETQILEPKARAQFIRLLASTGLNVIEAGSFVSPKWVPQMADTDQVLAELRDLECVRFPVLVPNLKGLEAAIASGTKEIACFTAASDAFNQKNINCDILESLARIRPVIDQALAEGLRVRGYVSCIAGCPYQGHVSKEDVLRVSATLLEFGCGEISLGDTIGVATPNVIAELLNFLTPELGVEHLALHLHDTYGQALANILTGLDLGVRTFDSAVAGLGGCPYARGASGNVATEDLVYLLNGLGFDHGVDLDGLAKVGEEISSRLGRMNQSKVGRALNAKRGSAK